MTWETLGILGTATAVVALTRFGTALVTGGNVPFVHRLDILAAILLASHVALEGWRWQLVPLYAVVALLALGLLINRGRLTAVGPRRIRSRLVGLLGLAVLGIEAAAVSSFPVVRLPVPTGPYDVGTTIVRMSDASRLEELTDDPTDTRAFDVRLWYPATIQPGAKPLPYQDYQARRDLIATGGPPEFIFSHYKRSQSNAYLDPPVDSAGGPYPVLLFSVGLLNRQDDYQVLAEELASRGYVVAIPSTPYESEAERLPDGRVVPYSSSHQAAFHQHEVDMQPLWARFWAEDVTPGERADLARQMLALDRFMDEAVRIRVADARFVVDELEKLNRDAASLLAGQLDLSRLAIAGHSLGGAVAGQTCLDDVRLKACVNLDGFPWGDLARRKLRQPYLLIESEQFRGATASIQPALSRGSYAIAVEGSRHGNFQDTPVVMPGAKLLGMAGSIDTGRMNRLTADYIAYFLDESLNGRQTPLSNGPLPEYPEVQLETLSIGGRGTEITSIVTSSMCEVLPSSRSKRVTRMNSCVLGGEVSSAG